MFVQDSIFPCRMSPQFSNSNELHQLKMLDFPVTENKDLNLADKIHHLFNYELCKDRIN